MGPPNPIGNRRLRTSDHCVVTVLCRAGKLQAGVLVADDDQGWASPFRSIAPTKMALLARALQDGLIAIDEL
ncbi:hypothetical protein RQCS_48560 [Rhodococcus qingshengii]|nr:hypothetical protein RE2895_49000 [Rhodococcus erythropolis]BCF85311.1 hypothetical protein RQCS_48560 [Rhodococcus qingshengii]